MRLSNRILIWAAGLALIGMGARSASANSITVQIDSPTISSLGDGMYEWTYNVVLSVGSQVVNGSFFELVDFGPGTVTATPTNWTASSRALSTVTGANAQLGFNGLPLDTGVQNLVFTYTGPTSPETNVGGDFLGFKIITPWGSSKPGAIIGRDVQFGTTTNQTNFGPATVPVPLPAAAWSGLGLLGVLGVARVRKAMR